jgi:hypothetical protein
MSCQANAAWGYKGLGMYVRSDKECVQKFDRETPWKTATWKTRKFGQYGGCYEIVYNDVRWMEVAENHVQKRVLVLAVLDVPVLLISDRAFKMW